MGGPRPRRRTRRGWRLARRGWGMGLSPLVSRDRIDRLAASRGEQTGVGRGRGCACRNSRSSGRVSGPGTGVAQAAGQPVGNGARTNPQTDCRTRSRMRIAIASGKGGTGKTTVATNLAWLASQNGLAAAYLDCDTEEPNGHLFLRPAIDQRREIVRMIPQVDPARCTLCGQCGEICQYSAIVCLEQKVLVFPSCAIAAADARWFARRGRSPKRPAHWGLSRRDAAAGSGLSRAV